MLDYRTKTFLTLYKLMNYRKTAETLNMTQPGVTQHIHYLEAHYGVRLFTYDGRQLHCTEYAHSLKKHLESITSAERALRESFTERQGLSLEIGATKTIGEYVLPPVLEAFPANGKNTVRFVIDNTENLLAQLSDSKLDFAVIEGVFDKERYAHKLYKKERFVGICAKDHPFAGKIVPLSTALEQTLVLRETGSGTRRLLERALEDKGFGVNSFARCLSVNNFAVITGLVAKGQAVTFAYAPVAKSREDLAVFEVEDMPMAGEFNFVFCHTDTAIKKIDGFFACKTNAECYN